MTDWYLFSIAALILLGVQRFLYKVAAERGCSSALTTAVFMGTVTLLSGAVFLVSGESAGRLSALFVLALVNSASFALATVAHMEALKHLPATVVFPLTRLSIVLVIAFSIVWLGERPQPMQGAGMLLGLSVVFVLGRGGGGSGSRGSIRTGLLFAAACVLCGAIASISSKLAAVSTSKAGFMALSYLLGTFFALAMAKRSGGKPGGKTAEAVGIGLFMGVLNFFGFYAFLTALESGPLSIIALIAGMHFVIAVALSVLLYREKMTHRRILGIGLTLLAVVLMQW
jgi:drug/metabolite transporter (DMT)-like permease